jgi:hypothetical protein
MPSGKVISQQIVPEAWLTTVTSLTGGCQLGVTKSAGVSSSRENALVYSGRLAGSAT